jgi:electron transfer flavoprotein beta subunit
MKILVCIKQVPDTSDIRWTENNTICREGLESVTNPCDVYAVEEAVKLGGGAEVTALTMGPQQAETALRGAIAAGCGKGVLLSDRKFSGADTFATSRTISAAIKKHLNDFNLIICGQFASDGDTAQTGPEIAECLGIPQITYVKEIKNIEDGMITVKRELDEGIETVRAKLPALICMLKGDYEPARPLINDVMRAQNAEITVYSAEDLELRETGLKGSPTNVSKSFRMVTKHRPQILGSIEEVAEKIKEFNV